MDPIGLGLENYDGIGAWRLTENDVIIDASGDLDGDSFVDPVDLARAVHDHPGLSKCLVRRTFEVATGRSPLDGEQDLLDWHLEGFEAEHHRVSFLFRDLATSPAFRHLQEATP